MRFRSPVFRQAVLLLLLGVACLLGGCNDHGEPTRASPGLDLSGQLVNPFEGTNIVVLIFVSNDCPLSNRYAPELRRLCETYTPLGVAFWLVHAAADESAESIRKHTDDYQLSCGILRDPKQELTRRSRAQVTPEAAVFVPPGRLVYHGRIDDRAVALGQERAVITKHDLEEVITGVLAGRREEYPSQPAIGCSIPKTP